jgi:hypothetical protein
MFESIYTQQQLQHGQLQHNRHLQLQELRERYNIDPALRYAQLVTGTGAAGLAAIHAFCGTIHGIQEMAYRILDKQMPQASIPLKALYDAGLASGAAIGGLSLGFLVALAWEEYRGICAQNSKPYKGVADS